MLNKWLKKKIFICQIIVKKNLAILILEFKKIKLILHKKVLISLINYFMIMNKKVQIILKKITTIKISFINNGHNQILI